MSRNHYIIPKQQYDLTEFFGLVTKIEGIQYEDRGNDIYFFWMEGKSARGMDFSVSGDRLELRMTNFPMKAIILLRVNWRNCLRMFINVKL